MTININGLPDISNVRESKIVFYNTVKRYEEDLLRRIPCLQQCDILIMQARQIKYSPDNLWCFHKLAPDESTLKLNFYYRHTPTMDHLLKEVTTQLKTLLSEY